jgi:hypothetical protein
VIAVGVLLLLNLLLMVAVYIRLIRQSLEPIVNAVFSGEALAEREVLRRQFGDPARSARLP